MAVDIDENENNEKIKDIWVTYKKFILIGLGILLLIFFGINYLANQKIQSNELASQLYQEVLIEKMDNLDTIKSKTSILKEDHSNTPYAGRASLHLGQLLAKTGKFEDSISELKWASENATEISIQSLSFYSLAINFIVKEDLVNAKVSAESIRSKGYEALKMDLLGDIYLQEGNNIEARKAYEQALNFYKDRNDLAQVIQTKLDAIGK